MKLQIKSKYFNIYRQSRSQRKVRIPLSHLDRPFCTRRSRLKEEFRHLQSKPFIMKWEKRTLNFWQKLRESVSEIRLRRKREGYGCYLDGVSRREALQRWSGDFEELKKWRWDEGEEGEGEEVCWGS